MDVVCDKCQVNFKIPDEKVPRGRVFSLACPKCKNKIFIDTRPDTKRAGSSTEKTVIDEIAASTYDASEKPFDFVEEGVETALLCEPDPDIRANIRASLENMGYHTTEAKSPIKALKQMRFHIFDLIVISELFGTDDPEENNVLRYLARLAMDTRRKIFVVLVTGRFRTMDNMIAFNKSVNLVVNLKNIDEIEKILKRGIADNELFYRTFRESLGKTGGL